MVLFIYPIQELLKFLDDVALDVFTSGGVGVFPYKSFAEVVSLVMISMLREVLRNSGENIIIHSLALHVGELMRESSCKRS